MNFHLSERFLRGSVAALICLFFLGALSGCKGWTPESKGSAGSSSYKATPDGYYRVRRGDTLHAIAFKYNTDWRNIAAWNNIRSPYTIYPDQELRLTAPSGKSKKSGVTTAAAASPGKATTKPLDSTSKSSTQPVAKAAPPKTASSTDYNKQAKPASVAKPAPAKSTSAAADPAKWLWPVEGRIISNFKANDPARKGIDIGGKEGQAVKASAAGEVVYSGSGLIGYGELVIIKHNERLLSAYAHNKKRLVQEGQKVSAGERIADMGRNDRNQAMLHFEIRLNGTPQDPLKFLTKR